MNLVINGVSQEAPEGVTLAGLLALLKVAPERVAVEVNLSIVNTGHYAGLLLNEEDRIEIISFVGGG